MKLGFSFFGMRNHEVASWFLVLFGAANFFSAAAFWLSEQPLVGATLTFLGWLCGSINKKIDR